MRRFINRPSFHGVLILLLLLIGPEIAAYKLYHSQKLEDPIMYWIIFSELLISYGLISLYLCRRRQVNFYRKKYQDELQQKALNHHYEYLTMYANDIILLLDENLKIVYANERAVLTYGYSLDELYQLDSVVVLRPPEVKESISELIKVEDADGLVYKTLHQRKDGTIFPIEVSLRLIIVEGNKYYQAINRDITERVRAEEALQEQLHFLQRLIDNIPNPIFYKDSNGIYQGCNTAFEAYVGLLKEQIVGKSVYDISPPDLAKKYAQMDLELLSKLGVQTYESTVAYLNTQLTNTNEIVTLIKKTLKENNFVLHYQPVFSMNGNIAHYEALIRIKRPNKQLIAPNDFIPVAERFGMMPQIDQWVVKAALAILKQNPQIKIFVNISGMSLEDGDFLESIETSIRESGIIASRIGFEITETIAVKDFIRAARWIEWFKRLGCQFALDDFGMGFSSFAYLRMLPVDYLKIDGAFVRNMDKDPTQRALIQAINAVAHTLGKKTIAEFVENKDIYDSLKELNVDLVQGYYLGKPAPFPQDC